MGLIDYLGKWNMNRRLEMLTKQLRAHFIRQNTDFSVKPPDEFAKRFTRKVRRIFRVPKSALQQKINIDSMNYSNMLLKQAQLLGGNEPGAHFGTMNESMK